MSEETNLPAHLIEAPHELTPTSMPWSPGLGKLMTGGALTGPSSGGDGASAIRLIAINRTLRAEAERLYPLLQEAARAKPEPDPDHHEALVLAVLVKYAPALGVGAKADGTWGTIWDVYLDALMNTPVDWVVGAFKRWNANLAYPDQLGRHAFYPRPAEILAQADAYRREITMAAYRCGKALDWKPPPAERTPEDRARERQAAIDEGLITPDGRAIISLAMKPMEPRPAAGSSPQEVAAQLRARVDDVGDVV